MASETMSIFMAFTLRSGGRGLNFRLDAKSVAVCLEHGAAKLLIADREFSGTIEAALKLMKKPPPVVDIDDPLYDGGKRLSNVTYEELLAEGDIDDEFPTLTDEWQAICLLYMSGP